MHMSSTDRLRREEGFAMVVAVLVLFICGLIVAATVAASREDITLTRTYSNQQRAYFAALAGVQAYKYQLSQNSNYWTTCPKTSAPVSVPGVSEETYEYKTLPSKQNEEKKLGCESGKLTSIVESADSASGTFRIEVEGKISNSHCGASTCKRAIIATFTHPSFLDYVFVSNFELVDPITVGKKSASECEYYYKEREEGKGSGCVNFPWIGEDSIEGPFHTNDAADISGEPTFGRSGHNDPIEMDQGYYGGTPKFNGTGYTKEGPVLLPPETGGELITEAEQKYKGRTVLVLKETTMEVKNGGTTKTVAFPANGVVAVQNGAKGCSITYTPFFPSYTADTECGNVYVSGKYTESLTIIAENDIIINGSITTTGGESGGEPTGAATLGLIADKYVRLYHPLTGECESGEVAKKCEAKENPAGSAEYECKPSTVENAKSTTDTATKELGGALESPVIDAAILSTKNSWGVDNFACGKSLGKITIWGSIAEDWRGRVTCCASGGDYIKAYKWDSRLESDQPPDFLAPSTNSGWKLERETAPPET